MLERVPLLAAVLLALALVACGDKSSGLEGKVTDGAGKPVAGLKIIAKQMKPIKGYEQFETVSDSDGSFKFKGLYPSSPYVIEPWSEHWYTQERLEVTAAPNGETLMNQSLAIKSACSRQGGNLVMDLATGKTRFTVSPEGVITDNITGLEWVVGPDERTHYRQADDWVKACGIAGGGWRMPTWAELNGLYAKGVGLRNIDPVFKMSGSYVWAGPLGSARVWNFIFNKDDQNWHYRDVNAAQGRAFGVRQSRSQANPDTGTTR